MRVHATIWKLLKSVVTLSGVGQQNSQARKSERPIWTGKAINLDVRIEIIKSALLSFHEGWDT